MKQIFINDIAFKLKKGKPGSGKRSIHFDELKEQHLEQFVANTKSLTPGESVIIWGEKPIIIREYFIKNLHYLEAGGGLVINPKGEILFIKRLGKWDLPKGKPENGENIRQTAIREVKEECSVSKLEIIAPLPSTFHIYPLVQGKYAIKQSYWFVMYSNEWENIKAQTEEDITEVKWLQRPIPRNILEGAFLSIRWLLTYYQKNY